jgi:hypothetical protein
MKIFYIVFLSGAIKILHNPRRGKIIKKMENMYAIGFSSLREKNEYHSMRGSYLIHMAEWLTR